MKLAAMMCAASAGLGLLASLNTVAVRGPFVALQMAFALATYSAFVGAAGAALALLVALLPPPPQPAAAKTSAAPAASAVGFDRTVKARRRETSAWLSKSRCVLTLMGLLVSSAGWK